MSEREKLEQAIAAQEGLRGTLDDAIIDATIAALRKQLEALAATGQAKSRKLVTILFMDTVGSTEMVRILDPEDNLAIMDTALQRLSAPVEQFGGRVTRYMGDGFLAVFGLPVARENDPVMAVHAGLGILAASVEYAREVEEKWNVKGFNVRVGVDTGSVVTGGQSEGEDTLAGRAVNLAARLESAAAPGTLLISRHTYQHVRGVFDFQSKEPIQAKGFPDPIPVYHVLRAKGRSFRTRRRGVEGIETPMVGRQAELDALQDSYYEVVEEGQRQIVTIVGEAGLGKSRLLYEFENWADLQPQPMAPYRGRARQETRRLPYSLLRDLFAFHFAIQDDDPAQIVRQKLLTGFAAMLGSGDTTEMKVQFVGQLLGYDFRASRHITAVIDDPQQIWERAQGYIADYFQAASGEQPLVLLLEDIHWADDASLDVLSRLILALDKYPVLLVCAARPAFYERRPHWLEGRTFHRRLDLRPLSRRDSRRLVKELLQKVEQLPESLRELVVSNAEGNPFYVEELIKMLIEDGVVIKGVERWQVELTKLENIQVPATLTGVLQARLDGLPQEERLVLQQASVIGRVFWDAVIAHLNHGDTQGLAEEALRHSLDALHRREMVYRRDLSAFAGTAEHIFKHAILHEVTYETVLKRSRRAYHAMVAEWLIQHSSERADEIPQVIAYHLERAGKKLEALHYLRQAGAQAAASYANEEAIDHFRKALFLAGQIDVADKELAALYMQLGRVLEISDHYDDALAVYEQMERTAHERGDRPMLLASYVGRLTLHTILSPLHDLARAEDLSEWALDLAQEIGDQRAEARILWNRLNLYRFSSRLILATEYGERSLALARKLNMSEQIGYTLNDLGHCYREIGKVDKSLQALREAGAVWRKLDNMPMLADSLSTSVIVYRYAGQYDEALIAADEAYTICQSIGNVRGMAYSQYAIGFIFWERGRPDRALQTMEECLKLTELADFSILDIFTRSDMASVYAGLGDPRRGLEMALMARAEAEANLPHYRGVPLNALIEIYLIEGEFSRVEAVLDLMRDETVRGANVYHYVFGRLAGCRILFGRGNYEEAVDEAQKLFAESTTMGMGAFALEALYLWGRAQVSLGQIDDARIRLQEARTAAESLGSQRMLWPILFSLSQITADPQEALQLRQQAQAIIHTFSANIAAPDLRASFLNQPQVQAVLETSDR